MIFFFMEISKVVQLWFQSNDMTKYKNCKNGNVEIQHNSIMFILHTFIQAACCTKRPLASQRIVTIRLNVDRGL